MMQAAKRFLTFGFLTLAFGGIAAAVVIASRSSLFVLQVVEIADQPEDSPVSASEILSLANIPVGQVNLFRLNLKEVENRIRSSSWIRDVRLQKSPPQTLSIAVTYREPKALMRTDTGSVVYVDSEGKRFGKINLQYHSDLPLLSGMGKSDPARTKDAIGFISRWEKSAVSKHSEIASLDYDAEHGYRAVLTYPVQGHVGRAWLELGQDFDGQTPQQLERLSRVIDYLSGHGITVRQIWADAGKKIVVKTARGS